jgi:hypothetical protein
VGAIITQRPELANALTEFSLMLSEQEAQADWDARGRPMPQLLLDANYIIRYSAPPEELNGKLFRLCKRTVINDAGTNVNTRRQPSCSTHVNVRRYRFKENHRVTIRIHQN